MTFLKISVVLIIQFAIVLVTIGQTPKIEFWFSCEEELNAIGLDYAEIVLINHSDNTISVGKNVIFQFEAKIASGEWFTFYENSFYSAHPAYIWVGAQDTLLQKIQINLLNLIGRNPQKAAYLLKKGGEIDLRIITYDKKDKGKIASTVQKIKVVPLSEQDLKAYDFLKSVNQEPSYLTDYSYLIGYQYVGLNEVIQNFPNSTFAILAKIALVNNEENRPRLKPLKTAKKIEMKREMDALKDSPYEFIRNIVKEANDRLEKMETRD